MGRRRRCLADRAQSARRQSPRGLDGASIATRLPSAQLRRAIAILLVAIAAILLFAHNPESAPVNVLSAPRIVAGVVAGFAIGVVASFMGVAGGELLIPTLVLLFGVPLKLAGSLSLVVSVPTMLVGFGRYSRDRSFSVLRSHGTFALAMAAGSILGALLGGRLLGVIPELILLPALAAILLISAYKAWTHAKSPRGASMPPN
jgi:uncharacterized membrane protein YfcA